MSKLTIDTAKILLCQMYLPQFDEEEKQALHMAIEALEELKQYKELEEQGLLLRLPCKVGTLVYTIAHDCGGDTLDCRCMDCEDCRYLYTFVEENAFDTYMCDEIGKSIFLTKEEAEQALERLKGE